MTNLINYDLDFNSDKDAEDSATVKMILNGCMS
jgi:hypothetical protein